VVNDIHVLRAGNDHAVDDHEKVDFVQAHLADDLGEAGTHLLDDPVDLAGLDGDLVLLDEVVPLVASGDSRPS